MSRRKTSIGTPATVALDRAGVDHTVHIYDHDPGAASRSLRRSRSNHLEGYGLEAAAALGLDPASVFKTLLAAADGTLVVAVVPVTGQLDLKALASAVGAKRTVMADPAAAERSTGYVVGGISPLGQRTRLRTVIDDTAARLATMYVSAGRRGADIGLAPPDLVRLLDATYAPIGTATSG